MSIFRSFVSKKGSLHFRLLYPFPKWQHSFRNSLLGLGASAPIVKSWFGKADSWKSSVFWRLWSQQFHKCFISVLFWLQWGQVRSGSDFTGLNFLSDLVVNQGHERGDRVRERVGEGRTERKRERECNAKHLTFLIQELADLPVIQCFSVY